MRKIVYEGRTSQVLICVPNKLTIKKENMGVYGDRVFGVTFLE